MVRRNVIAPLPIFRKTKVPSVSFSKIYFIPATVTPISEKAASALPEIKIDAILMASGTVILRACYDKSIRMMFIKQITMVIIIEMSQILKRSQSFGPPLKLFEEPVMKWIVILNIIFYSSYMNAIGLKGRKIISLESDFNHFGLCCSYLKSLLLNHDNEKLIMILLMIMMMHVNLIIMICFIIIIKRS